MNTSQFLIALMYGGEKKCNEGITFYYFLCQCKRVWGEKNVDKQTKSKLIPSFMCGTIFNTHIGSICIYMYYIVRKNKDESIHT